VGYFHLAGHGLPSELPSSAVAELSQLDTSTHLESNLRTLGFSEEEGEEEQDVDGGADDPAVVFDACEGDMDALPAAAEYARRMRDVGMRVVALLSGCHDTGFREEPFAEGRRKPRCLVWASRVSTADTAPPVVGKAKAYPYVVALHCQWEASRKEEAPPSWLMEISASAVAVASSPTARPLASSPPTLPRLSPPHPLLPFILDHSHGPPPRAHPLPDGVVQAPPPTRMATSRATMTPASEDPATLSTEDG